MEEQTHFYFPVEGDVKYSPNDARVVTPGYHMSGGFPLDRLSNTSSESQLSYSSENCLSPLSHADNMSNSSLYGNNSLPSQQYDSSLNYPYFSQAETRHTPSSLGWPRGTELVKLYKFIVPKGKSPYFQLQERFTPTYETPQRVHLDELTYVLSVNDILCFAHTSPDQGRTKRINFLANIRDYALERSVSSVGQQTLNATIRMSTPTKRIHSLATTESVLDPKKKTLSRERITTETIFETTIRKISAVPKARSHQERKIKQKGRKHKNYGLPNAKLTARTGAVPNASSRTMLNDMDGNVRHARVSAKKIVSELARTLVLRCKPQKITAKLPWWVALSMRLPIAPLAMVACMLIMDMAPLHVPNAILLRDRIPMRISSISSN
jgi:hypothetical protein